MDIDGKTNDGKVYTFSEQSGYFSTSLRQLADSDYASDYVFEGDYSKDYTPIGGNGPEYYSYTPDYDYGTFLLPEDYITAPDYTPSPPSPDPVPTSEPPPEPTPAPKPPPDPIPAPQPPPEPVATPQPTPEPVPTPQPPPQPVPTPPPPPQPAPVPSPQLPPAPVPAPDPQPPPDPVPSAQPVPAPVAAPQRPPDSVPSPDPLPDATSGVQNIGPDADDDSVTVSRQCESVLDAIRKEGFPEFAQLIEAFVISDESVAQTVRNKNS